MEGDEAEARMDVRRRRLAVPSDPILIALVRLGFFSALGLVFLREAGLSLTALVPVVPVAEPVPVLRILIALSLFLCILTARSRSSSGMVPPPHTQHRHSSGTSPPSTIPKHAA